MIKKLDSYRNRKKVIGLLFISPWLIGFLLFCVRNLIEAGRFSLSEFAMKSNGGFDLKYVGLDNYKYAFTENTSFVKTLVDSLMNMLTDLPLILFFSLFVAILLNSKFRGRTVVRTIFFLPIIFIIPVVISALNNTLSSMAGGISGMPADMNDGPNMSVTLFLLQFTEFGIPMGMMDYIIGAVGRIYEIINASGIQILIFLAALQSIPNSMYEVSQIEGATAYETFWKITLPLVSPMILINTVYTIIDSYVKSPMLKVSYHASFEMMNFSVGAVYAIVGSFFICLLLAVVSFSISRYVFYQS